MGFTLLELAEGGVSLEMRPDDLGGLRRRLTAAFGEIGIIEHATFDEVVAAGERFLFVSDWDSPCLISTTAAGADMLRGMSESAHAIAAE